MYKKIMEYFSKHTVYNSTIHFIGGVGLGALLTNAYFAPHPVRWGVILISIAILGHLYPLMTQKGRRK